jgi:hypothetical protein
MLLSCAENMDENINMKSWLGDEIVVLKERYPNSPWNPSDYKSNLTALTKSGQLKATPIPYRGYCLSGRERERASYLPQPQVVDPRL